MVGEAYAAAKEEAAVVGRSERAQTVIAIEATYLRPYCGRPATLRGRRGACLVRYPDWLLKLARAIGRLPYGTQDLKSAVKVTWEKAIAKTSSSRRALPFGGPAVGGFNHFSGDSNKISWCVGGETFTQQNGKLVDDDDAAGLLAKLKEELSK